ncbi:MAG TPA: pitrilysin family protein, partial [Gemmatimonadaceae bacterium]
EIALSLEALGGSLDAYTSREHTVYQGRVLDEHLAQAADVIGDIVFDPTLKYDDLLLERKVILEEIGMVEDTPDDLVFELHNEALWGPHPYGYSILGTRDTVKALGVSELRALHARAYHPGQLVIAAAGNVEHERLLEILDETGWLDRPTGDVSPLTLQPPRAEAPTTRHVSREGAQTHIVAGTTAIPHGDPRRFPLLLLSTLLGGGMSSRLFQRVREELGLAYAVYTYQTFHADTGMHGVYVATAPESASAALDAIRTELQAVVEHGIPADEVAMGRQQLKGQVTLSLESVSSRMYRAASVELYHEPYRTLDDLLALIDSISADDVANVAREFFAPERLTVVSLGPKGA